MPNAVPEKVIKALSAAFEQDSWIDVHKYPIMVWAENGRVILDGKVGDIAAKRRALSLARQLIADRWPIMDLLRRDPMQPMNDRELRDSVVKRLSLESVLAGYTLRTEVNGEMETQHDAGPSAYEIQAHIRNGSVKLTGVVGSLTHQRLAEVAVWWAFGCETVDNQLQIIPPEEDNDNEVTDAIRMALETDPLVHADRLRVGTTNGGVVQMEGSVASEEEKRCALLDAWYVPGVSDVQDHIMVRG
jgi:osmotically-inducible protein OsmY